MAKLSASFYLLAVLFAFSSVTTRITTVNGDCTLATIGGGCPDKTQCAITCGSCYRGVGTIDSYCQPAGGGIPSDECICVMKQGATCNISGEPKCPNWPRHPPAANFTENNNV